MSGRYIINEKVTEYLDSFYHSPDDALGILRAEAEGEVTSPEGIRFYER